jgi:Domain of unknown function (DUF4157)
VLQGSGQPLAAPVKEEMEARLGADLSGVRIHADSAARASAAEVSARAYTSGSHIVIGDGGADKHMDLRWNDEKSVDDREGGSEK